jgi:hypothetical protein
MFFCLLIEGSGSVSMHIRIQIQESQSKWNPADPDPDPEYCKKDSPVLHSTLPPSPTCTLRFLISFDACFRPVATVHTASNPREHITRVGGFAGHCRK